MLSLKCFFCCLCQILTFVCKVPALLCWIFLTFHTEGPLPHWLQAVPVGQVSLLINWQFAPHILLGSYYKLLQFVVLFCKQCCIANSCMVLCMMREESTAQSSSLAHHVLRLFLNSSPPVWGSVCAWCCFVLLCEIMKQCGKIWIKTFQLSPKIYFFIPTFMSLQP